MDRVVALVEGQTEDKFMKAAYARALVQRPFPNGKTVSIELIVECIRDALETLSGELNKVIVLLDREKRSATALDFRSELAARLASACPGRQFYIGVSDIQIENWILADEALMQKEFSVSGYTYSGDGTPGKRDLRSLSRKSLGPQDTALLLKRCSALGAAEKSSSLEAFIKSIDFDWAWATS